MRSIIILASIIFLSACNQQPHYTIVFDEVENVKVGTNVLIEGLTVGKVTKIDLLNESDPRIAVNFELTKDVRIPAGSKFTAMENILGDTYIMIKRSESAQFMQPTDTVAGVYAPLPEIFTTTDSAQREKVRQSLNKIGEGVKEILQTLKDSTNK